MLFPSVVMMLFVILFSAALSWDGEKFIWRQFFCMLVLGTFAWFFGLTIGGK